MSSTCGPHTSNLMQSGRSPLAKRCSKCREFLPIASFGKDSSTTDGLKYRCKPCISAYKAQFRAQNPDKVRYWASRWSAENPEKSRAGLRRRTERWNLANKQKRRQMTEAWFEKNPGVRAMYSAKRRAAIAVQFGILKECHIAQVEEIYREAQRVSQKTGIPHHVDHIIPLNADGVCGLHVPWNLQIIPAKQNIEKNNRIPPNATGLAFLRIEAK